MDENDKKKKKNKSVGSTLEAKERDSLRVSKSKYVTS